MPLQRPLAASVFDYLRDMVLVVDEPADIEQRARSLLDELQRNFERIEAADELALAPSRLFLTPDELRARINDVQRIELRLLGSAALNLQEELSTEDVGQGGRDHGPEPVVHQGPHCVLARRATAEVGTGDEHLRPVVPVLRLGLADREAGRLGNRDGEEGKEAEKSANHAKA